MVAERSLSMVGSALGSGRKAHVSATAAADALAMGCLLHLHHLPRYAQVQPLHRHKVLAVMLACGRHLGVQGRHGSFISGMNCGAVRKPEHMRQVTVPLTSHCSFRQTPAPLSTRAAGTHEPSIDGATSPTMRGEPISIPCTASR